ncbi:TonB family protein [Coraliomargarita parva]|uniref:TonB family protein n=1 Tax=Coraliomargarita parva TaxID=3014050 RepID=UPI0022B5CF8E|nr:TonB family protein [Coraliomargarita parva]
MNWKNNQPFWTSVILHLVVLLGLFLATIVEAFKPKEKEHVFIMVSPPADTVADRPSVDTNEPIPQFDLPEISQLQPVPEIPEVQPAPQPKPQPVVKQTQPAPAPKPTPKQKSMTYEEYKKQFGEPKARKQPTVTRPTTEVRQIDTDSIQDNLKILLRNQTPRQSSGNTLAKQNALAQYGAQLNARLNRAWGKPSNLAGVRLSVTVVFDVSPSGQIYKMRLQPSSGNSAFDQSVLAAFQRVANAGPTPTGEQHTFTMTFRMTE